MIRRVLFLTWWAVCYGASLLSFVYLAGFIGNRYTFSTIDSGLQLPFREALAVDCALLLLFFAQHSGMARAGFKRVWRRILPFEMERPAYLLATSAALALIYFRWEPMPEPVWSLRHPAAQAVLHALFWLGWVLVIVSSLLIGHWDFAGLKQAIQSRYEPPAFRAPGPYAWVRHPMMLGLLTAFWATPEMSRGHLLFAAANTLYGLAAIRWEERDLIAAHGADYFEYREKVPRLCPFFRQLRRDSGERG